MLKTKTIVVQNSSPIRLLSTFAAGAIASFITQPLQVIKTNRINSPAIFYADLHKKIISSGWKTYMRGSSLAVARQAYGFTLYTHLLNIFQTKVQKNFPRMNKIYNYSISSVLSKLIAMVFEAPLTLIKTRVQCMGSRQSIVEEFKYILKNPFTQLKKGLGSSIAREGLYTLFHYNTYRFLKDQVFTKQLKSQATFIPAFIAGIVAITVSQPFEVLRSQISLKKFNEPVLKFALNYFRQFGYRGFFVGFVPRLLRKPINSGICWTVVQYCRKMQ